MRQKVHLVCGVPASGKSWVCNQLKDKFAYAPHDALMGHANHPEVYAKQVLDLVDGDRPVLAEAPFSVSELTGRLQARGIEVIHVYITADESTLHSRWDERGRQWQRAVTPSTRKGHLSRQETYKRRAMESKSFIGTSSEVLNHLRAK